MGFYLLAIFRNHKGELDFPCAVDSYLLTELALGSVCGPFARNPFVAPIALSPLILACSRLSVVAIGGERKKRAREEKPRGRLRRAKARESLKQVTLNAVPKPDSDERRFILDLSWPAGSSVSDWLIDVR